MLTRYFINSIVSRILRDEMDSCRTQTVVMSDHSERRNLMTENREYKSDAFSMLMQDRENALQVYNALNESSYDDPESVEIVSLESGISLSIRNDAAFIVGTDFNIYEHQASYNPNMPIRALYYYATIMQEMLNKRDLYSTRLINIPTPHFVVFYNGVANRPEKEVMKLSAAFEKPTDRPELELICTVYNINPDKNEEILQKCSILREYTAFVETVRKYDREGNESPVENAIKYCIENHILEKFLRERGAEVLKTMAIDMTFERREILIREEEKIEGRKEGRIEGRKEGADMLASLLKQLTPGSDEFNRALNATEEERQELYKKYNISQ